MGIYPLWGFDHAKKRLGARVPSGEVIYFATPPSLCATGKSAVVNLRSMVFVL